jgi:hypothetical protein
MSAESVEADRGISGGRFAKGIGLRSSDPAVESKPHHESESTGRSLTCVAFVMSCRLAARSRMRSRTPAAIGLTTGGPVESMTILARALAALMQRELRAVVDDVDGEPVSGSAREWCRGAACRSGCERAPTRRTRTRASGEPAFDHGFSWSTSTCNPWRQGRPE